MGSVTVHPLAPPPDPLDAKPPSKSERVPMISKREHKKENLRTHDSEVRTHARAAHSFYPIAPLRFCECPLAQSRHTTRIAP
jgi:hypothetical protein